MSGHAILRTRLSFLWTRTFFDFFEGQNAAKNLPFSFFATTGWYKAKYDELRNSEVDANGLSLPWSIKQTGKNYFWTHYLKGNKREDLKSHDAWDAKIPFRKQVEIQITSPDAISIRSEGFFYQHGVVALITIDLGECESLKAWTEKALQFRHDKLFTKESEGIKFSLNDIADEFLNSFSVTALGENKAKGWDFTGDPFSLVTVIEGAEGYADEPLVQEGEIHKSLEKLATWNDLWPSGEKPKLEERSFANVKNKIDNHCVYAGKHGRVIWFPKRFSQKPGQRHSLGCYHRNLTLASLQTASLSAFISHVEKESKGGNPLTGYLKNWARGAITILNGFTTGENTYRTWSTRDQIEKNEVLDAVTYLNTTVL